MSRRVPGIRTSGLDSAAAAAAAADGDGSPLSSPDAAAPPGVDKASLDYQMKFDLHREEILYEDYICALQRGILHQGRLYLSQSYICFYSSIPLVGEVKLVLRADSIASVELAKVGFIFPTAIRLTAHDGQAHLFASFIHRDRAYKTLQRLVRRERVGEQKVKSAWELDAAEEELVAARQRGGSSSLDQPKHLQLLEKRAEKMRRSKRAAGDANEDEDEQLNGTDPGDRLAERMRAAAAQLQQRGGDPSAADDEDDPLAQFKKPTARSSQRSRAPVEAHGDEEDADRPPPARTRKSKRLVQASATDVPDEDAEWRQAGAASAVASSASAAAAAAAPTKRGSSRAGDLLVVPGGRANGPTTPGSAPDSSARRDAPGSASSAAWSRQRAGQRAASDDQMDQAEARGAGGSARRKKAAAAAASESKDDSSSDVDADVSDSEQEFGSQSSIFDAIPTYKLPDPRVTRIASRFRSGTGAAGGGGAGGGDGLSHTLHTRNRRLVYEGFVRRQGKMSAVDRWMFLFTDSILFAKIVEGDHALSGPAEEAYELKQRADLTRMVVDARPPEFQRAGEPGAVGGSFDLLRSTRLPNAFRIVALVPEPASFVVSVSTPQERMVWLQWLQFAIARHMRATEHPATLAPHNHGWWLKPVMGTIHGAAFDGDLALLRALLRQDPSPLHVNQRLDLIDGSTALHLAAQAHRNDVVAELLGPYAADQTVPDRDGLVPLHIAAKLGYVETVRALLRYADPKTAVAEGAPGACAAALAASGGYVQPCFDHSLWHPPPPSQHSSKRRAAAAASTARNLRLTSAIWQCALSRLREWQGVLRLLVSHVSKSGGAGKEREVLDDRDEDGRTLLEVCVLGSLHQVAPLIVSLGATLDLVGPDGLTPLGLAAQYANEPMLSCLVEAGAQPNLRSEPDMLAAAHHAPTRDVAAYLIENGARPRMVSRTGVKLASLFPRDDPAALAQLDAAIEEHALRPILLGTQPARLAPPGHAAALDCSICSDEFSSHSDKRAKGYCRVCALSVCAACSPHKLAFPLPKSGHRTVRPPPSLPSTSAAGGRSTFEAPPPVDPRFDVAPVCQGCFNAAYWRATKLRKERRRRRKARSAARQAARDRGDDPSEDEHPSESEEGAEGAIYLGVEAEYHAGRAAAALALQRDSGPGFAGLNKLGGAAVDVVRSGAEGVLSLVGLKKQAAKLAPDEETSTRGTGLVSQAQDALGRLGKLFTSVHVAAPRTTGAAAGAGGAGAAAQSSKPKPVLDGPLVAVHAGSTEEQQRLMAARSAAATARARSNSHSGNTLRPGGMGAGYASGSNPPTRSPSRTPDRSPERSTNRDRERERDSERDSRRRSGGVPLPLKPRAHTTRAKAKEREPDTDEDDY